MTGQNSIQMVPNGIEYHLYRYPDSIVLFSPKYQLALAASAPPTQNVADIERIERYALAKSDAKRIPHRFKCNNFMHPNLNILVSDKCQLDCAYCFSAHSRDVGSISLDRAIKGIDTVFRNASIIKKATGNTLPVRVNYNGGGEPTCNLEIIRECLEHTKRLESSCHVPAISTLQTNGQSDPAIFPELKGLGLEQVTLSMDGLKHVQDTQRTRLDSQSSFDKCIQTLSALGDLEIATSIRATLTKRSCCGFPDFCRHLDRQFPFVSDVSFDAVSLTGKGSSQRNEMPEPDLLCKSIGEARSATTNLRISTHLINLERYGYYCQSTDFGNAIFLSTSNYISLCQECTRASSDANDKFLIGTYDDSGSPQIRPFTTLGRFEEACASPVCGSCPALYTCSGGCHSRIRFSSGSPSADSDTQYWCALMKRLLKQELHDCFSDANLYPNAERINSDNGSFRAIVF